MKLMKMPQSSLSRLATLCLIAMVLSAPQWALAADEAMDETTVEEPAANTAPGLESADETGMTLIQAMRYGGKIMWLIGALSVFSLTLVLYLFVALRPGREAPKGFIVKVKAVMDRESYETCRRVCKSDGSMLARVLEAGLDVVGEDKAVIQEAMQAEGARASSEMWQRINYLSDIAIISPMIGILGTVMGMIDTFNVIALKAEVVKPIMLADGVRKALITTAGGLFLAIILRGFYVYFRGRGQMVASAVEVASAGFVTKLSNQGNNE